MSYKVTGKNLFTLKSLNSKIIKGDDKSGPQMYPEAREAVDQIVRLMREFDITEVKI